MFKKIVKSIAAIKTENDRDNCYWQIDRAFEEERISFEDQSSSTVWPVWLRSLNFFAFVCPF